MAAQWVAIPDHAGTALPLRERFKLLRRERSWPQAELAARVGANAGLLIEASPQRPLHAPGNALGRRLAAKSRLRTLAGGSADMGSARPAKHP